MAHKIETVSSRAKLVPRREPYWHRLRRGEYVGYRKLSKDSAGTWTARRRQDDGKQTFESLGTLEQEPPHARFDLAVASSNAWFQQVESRGNSKDIHTVADACERYVTHLSESKSKATAADAMSRYRRWVLNHRIAALKLEALSRDDCRDFRRDLVNTPVTRTKSGVTTDRSKDTVNRDVTALRAALNFAFAEGYVKSDFAWRETLKPFERAGKRRELYLDREQRQSLILSAPIDLGDFLRGLAILPLRPGALAALSVSSFDVRLSVLSVGKDKHGQDRKLKLPLGIARLFERACANKTATLPIFTRADGRPWHKDAWKHPVKEAAAKAGLPAAVTAYTLRHSIITDLVHEGLDLLTVAQISGTSVAMIQDHYGHLRGEVAAAALEKVAGLSLLE